MPVTSAWPFPERGGLKAEWTYAMKCFERLSLVDYQGRMAPAGKEQMEAMFDLADEIALQLGHMYPSGPALQLAQFLCKGNIDRARRRVNAAIARGYDLVSLYSIKVE